MEEKKSNKNDSAAGRRIPTPTPKHKCTSRYYNLLRNSALPQYLQPGSISVSKALRGLAVDENITLNCTILSHFTSTKK